MGEQSQSDDSAVTEKCRFMAAAYPTLDAEDTCGKYGDHQHDEPTFSLARALAVASQHPEPTDEQVAWFLADAAAVVGDFAPATTSWQVSAPQEVREPRLPGIEFDLTINAEPYVIQVSEWEPSHPVRLDTYRSWHCTCGLEEQERTGHAPTHADFCELVDEDEWPRSRPAGGEDRG